VTLRTASQLGEVVVGVGPQPVELAHGDPYRHGDPAPRHSRNWPSTGVRSGRSGGADVVVPPWRQRTGRGAGYRAGTSWHCPRSGPSTRRTRSASTNLVAGRGRVVVGVGPVAQAHCRTAQARPPRPDRSRPGAPRAGSRASARPTTVPGCATDDESLNRVGYQIRTLVDGHGADQSVRGPVTRTVDGQYRIGRGRCASASRDWSGCVSPWK